MIQLQNHHLKFEISVAMICLRILTQCRKSDAKIVGKPPGQTPYDKNTHN